MKTHTHTHLACLFEDVVELLLRHAAEPPQQLQQNTTLVTEAASCCVFQTGDRRNR